jgi:hypothetical protein
MTLAKTTSSDFSQRELVVEKIVVLPRVTKVAA